MADDIVATLSAGAMSANWLDRLPDDYRPAARALSDALAAEIEIDAVLGVGGMGAVLAGHEKSLDRRVAVKLLSPALADDPVARERFLREAQAAAAVQHPHVVTVFRVGQAGANHRYVCWRQHARWDGCHQPCVLLRTHPSGRSKRG